MRIVINDLPVVPAGTNSTAASNASALPSKEVPGGSSVGVGSLPGSNSETSVAKLPEERVKEGTTGSTTQGAVFCRALYT